VERSSQRINKKKVGEVCIQLQQVYLSENKEQWRQVYYKPNINEKTLMESNDEYAPAWSVNNFLFPI
jgi:hypothetical protein